MSDEMSSTQSQSASTSSSSAALLSRIEELRNWQAQQRLKLEQFSSPSTIISTSAGTSSFSKPLPDYNDQRHMREFPLGLEYFDAYSQSCISHRSDDSNKIGSIKENEVSYEPNNRFGAQNEISELLVEDDSEDIGVFQPQSGPKRNFLRKGEGLRRFMGKNATTKKCSSPQSKNVQSKILSIDGQSTEKENLPPQVKDVKVKRPFLKKGEGQRRWKGLSSGSTKEDANKNVRELAPKTSKKELFKCPIPKLKLQALSDQIRPVAAHKDGLDRPLSGVNIDFKEKDDIDVEEINMYNVKCSKREFKGDKSTGTRSSKTETEKAFRKEEKELNAFEKLEELAADSSFSSNSSTVIQLLHQGLHSQSSTPLKVSASELTPVSSKSSLSDTSTLAAGTPKITSNNLLERFMKTGSNDLEELQDYIYENAELDGQLNISEMLEKLSQLMPRSEVADELGKNLEQSSPQTVDNLFGQNLQGHVTPLNTKSAQHVRFRPLGADILEYEGEDTLTDASSLTDDDTELVTTSELEALASLEWNFQERMKNCGLGLQFTELQKIDEEEISELKEGDNVTKESESSMKDVAPCLLEYSPPRKNLPKHAPHPVLGNKKNLDEQKVMNRKGADEKAKCQPSMPKMVSDPQPTPAESDVQTVKALLMTKVVELELEIEHFKKESAKISALQDKIEKEKKAFEDEKLSFKQEVKTEREKLKKYIGHEKQLLWKEKQALISKSQNQSKVDEDNLNYLEEKCKELQNEVQKKEANHLVAEKKLKEKLNFYEFENKSLKEKIEKMETLEKENKNLKVRLEKLEAAKKTTQLKSAQKSKGAQHDKKVVNKNKKSFKNISESINQQDFPKRDGNDISIQDVYPVRGINPKSLTKPNPTYHVRFQDHVNFTSTQSVQLLPVPDVPIDDNCTTVLPENVDDGDIQECVADEVEETTLAVPIATSSVFSADTSSNTPTLDCTENYNADGTLEIIYANGNKKEIHKNGTCIIHYYNGDVKEEHQDKVVYVYGSDQTRHITYKDGMEVVEFASGQREVRYPEGSSEIIFTDRTRKIVNPDGSEELITSDGTVICTKPDGSKVFQFTNGQREVHENGEKRREYPDGTIKILHSDGRVETHYRNGRRRVKDKEGNLLVDSVT
ncbi:uncharacterized protein LOC143020982 [Oratosquilla oratoria]|uniref:uncharacterized protein LOC143020982 n=1 Tax=Oratosquilla oratoria TaxID=337810 RepID=UPI003F76F44A